MSADTMIPVRGAGGGGKGGGGGGYVAADTLASRAYAKVVLAVSEGEVEGLANGMQDVLLDGTPLQNPDGTYNFTGISFVFTPGTQSQDYVPGFSDVENEMQVGLLLLASSPLTRTISDVNANAVRVTVNLPAIYYTNTSNGDVTGSSVDIAIDIQTNGGGYVQQVYDTISGKASQNYERSYRISLSGAGPWDIRVRRVTADSTTGNPVNTVYWTSYTEIIEAKLRYPNTACAYLTVDSGQFQSIPAVSLNLKGLRIQIPSNYDPVARTYSGAWDGTFKIAYSNNPAWCFYDLLTSTRYGLGNFVAASQIDKWALYSIGVYCDEPVPDGNGGQEPRFTLNAYIQNYAAAYQVVQDLASVFRGMPFWSTGSVTAVQDAPGDAVALFTNANVVDGNFTYTGSSLKGRHTVALVTWYDMNNQAQPTPEYVTISDADIAQYGEIITQVTAFGCTSRGQAHRVGRWILYSEKYEGETVAFKAGLDASPVRPGDIIKVSDSVRAGQRLGGRISGATANSVAIDSQLLDQDGNSVNPAGATLSVIGMDGSVQSATVGQAMRGVGITSFSRASTATYTNSAGVIVVAGADTPRLDYSTGAPQLLVENAATNFCPNSTGYGGTWGSTVVALNATASPDGQRSGGVASNNSSGYSGVTSANYTSPEAGLYTISVWLRADSNISIEFFGIWNNSAGAQQVDQVPCNLTQNWQRFVISGLGVAPGAQAIYWQINLAPGQTVYFWGTQIEKGTVATSYIPTSGAAATRAADLIVFSGVDASGDAISNGNTNLLTDSSCDTAKGWSLGVNAVRVGNIQAPDGSYDAVIYEGSASAPGSQYAGLPQSFTLVEGNTYTASVYAKIVSGAWTGEWYQGTSSAWYPGQAGYTLPAPGATSLTNTVNFVVSSDGYSWANAETTPAAFQNDDYLYARFTGSVFAPVSGTYTLGCNSDDGARLTINGTVLYDALSNGQGDTTDLNYTQSGQLTLTAGERLDILVEWQQGNGGAGIQLLWTLPGASSASLIQAQTPPAEGQIINVVDDLATDHRQILPMLGSGLTTSWQRFSLPFTPATTSAGTEIYVAADFGQGTQVAVWGAQIEEGGLGDYVPTAGTPATHAGAYSLSATEGPETLTLESALAVIPNAQALWMLELQTIQAQLFRIIQITRSDRAEFTVTALAYNPSKYGYIEDGLVLEQRQITDLTQPPLPPSGLVCTESLYSYQSTIFSMASLSWPAVGNVNGYIVSWSRNNGNAQIVNVAGAGFDLSKTDPGLYTFQVWSVGPNGKKSRTYASLTQQLYGKTLPPSNVQGLDYGWDYNNGLVLNWEPAPDIDLAVYEVRQGATWAAGLVLGQTKSTTFTPGTPQPGLTYWVAVLDTLGVYSAAPASVTPQLPQAAAPAVSAAFVGVNALIGWTVPASPLAVDHYLISMDGGQTIVATIKGTSYSIKATWSGQETFSVAAVDIAGTVGAWGAASLNLLTSTVTGITDQVVDNNVLLKWTVTQGSLPIDHYVVAEGASWASATVLGQTLGTFDTIFETEAGTKTYWVAGVDAAGNQGVPASLSAYVNPPPDYVLQYNLNSTWGGAGTNLAVDTNGARLAPIDSTTSFQAHFTNNSWSSPSDQVNAGYPLFIEPAPLAASYVETIDYGQVLPASNIVFTLSKTIITGSPAVSIDVAVSADNSTWTTYAGQSNVYVSNFRYAKVTVHITGSAGLDILRLDNLNIKYQVKQKTDSGTVACNASDTNGTAATFNIPFLDVTSITVTPSGTTPCFAIYDFAGGPSPTGFTIMLFDTSGNRISGTVSWNARGV